MVFDVISVLPDHAHILFFFFQKIEKKIRKKNIIKMIRIFYVDLKKALLKDLILMENICQSWRLIRNNLADNKLLSLIYFVLFILSCCTFFFFFFTLGLY